jgi:aldehyde dehydrogenase (NAD+)
MIDISKLEGLRRYFESGATRSFAFRKEQLKNLKQAIVDHEQELYTALSDDLKKSPEESWVTELGMVTAEINAAIKNLRNWMEPENVGTNLLNFPSSSKIMKEPLGVVLIVGPWNYPFQLLINPMVGAIAAGNCMVLKPSEYASATSLIIKKIIDNTFSEEYALCIEGDGARVIPSMINDFRFDHIFFTGSTNVGKSIYKMAAEKLIPVTLELGGKSPCIVEEDANIKVAARRIAVTKFSNAGQMCVAPDYILVHDKRKEELLKRLKEAVVQFFGDKAEEAHSYGRLINEKQFDRISSYMNNGRIVFGGRMDRNQLFIEPTVLAEVSTNSPVMKDEIFGPVLPVISFTEKEEALQIIRRHPNPLAFYVFTSSNKREKDWLESVSFGGGCVNNASWHLTNHHLPFGGRGFSGTGAYHGKYSFDTFSHRKAIMKTPTWFDPSIKYPPFKGKLKLFKKVIK